MLTEEIVEAQRSVVTDAYQMSIGELVNMYESSEIIIDPEFQRLFRWGISQKSKLIESLLLGIPLPSIFVFEKDDGTWELIDGLQRLSTILEFMGKLKDSDGGLMPPSILEATNYLPSLHNIVWEKFTGADGATEDEQRALEKNHQLNIRRSRISVEILKRTSDNQTKFDLFQRLNSGGTVANEQELRNCIMLMISPDYFRAIKVEAEQDIFSQVIAVSDEQKEKQRHMELAIRFLVHTLHPYDGKLDVNEYIDLGAISLCNNSNTAESAELIRETFSLLSNVAGPDSLRRFDGNGFNGRVTLTALEGIAVGIAKNLQAIKAEADPQAYVGRKVREFWQQPEIETFTTPGLRGTIRIQRTVPFGENWFRP